MLKLLIFCSLQVAERVLSRESHKIESLPVTVKAYKPAIEDNNIDDSNDSNNNSAQPIKIKVTGKIFGINLSYQIGNGWCLGTFNP